MCKLLISLDLDLKLDKAIISLAPSLCYPESNNIGHKVEEPITTHAHALKHTHKKNKELFLERYRYRHLKMNYSKAAWSLNGQSDMKMVFTQTAQSLCTQNFELYFFKCKE